MPPPAAFASLCSAVVSATLRIASEQGYAKLDTCHRMLLLIVVVTLGCPYSNVLGVNTIIATMQEVNNSLNMQPRTKKLR